MSPHIKGGMYAEDVRELGVKRYLGLSWKEHEAGESRIIDSFMIGTRHEALLGR